MVVNMSGSSASTNDSLEQRVRGVVAKSLGLSLDEVRAEDAIEDLTEDSIQMFELILAFEKEFKTEADYTDLIEIETLQDVVDYLSNRGL